MPDSNPLFEKAVTELFDKEGRYSNHVSDRGGPTMYGVTENVARAAGYTGDMKDLTEYRARQIAKERYWDTLRLDDVAGISYPVACELFDTAYNCGISVAGRFLQRALNVLNREQKDYPDVTVDGIVGMMTVHSLRLFIQKRGISPGQTVLLKALNALQGAYYIEICESRPANESFAFGWLQARVDL